MKYEIKCKNCGAPIPVSENQKINFCPFCGNSIEVDFDKYDFKKFKLQYEEEVRQRKVKEQIDKEKRDDRSFAIFFTVFVIMSVAIFTAIWYLEK